jgi:predicted ATPase
MLRFPFKSRSSRPFHVLTSDFCELGYELINIIISWLSELVNIFVFTTE